MSSDPDPQDRSHLKRKAAPGGEFNAAAALAALTAGGFKTKCQKWCTGASSGTWPGKGVRLRGSKSPRSPSPDDKEEARAQGMAFGCHACGRSPNSGWIADHIPPVGLTRAHLTAVGVPGAGSITYRFFPHCGNCASAQAALVKRIRKGTVTALAGTDVLQINDTRAGHSIAGQVGDPTDPQRLDIQRLGGTNGCHVCGGTDASTTYIADHVPPKEFGLNVMFEALRLMRVRVPKWQLRPHCRRCSNKQGSKVDGLVTAITAIMDDNGFQSTRGQQ